MPIVTALKRMRSANGRNGNNNQPDSRNSSPVMGTVPNGGGNGEKDPSANEPLVNAEHGLAGMGESDETYLSTKGSKEFLLPVGGRPGGMGMGFQPPPPPFYYPNGVPLRTASLGGGSAAAGRRGSPPPRYVPQDAMVMMINRRRAAQISSLATLLVFLTAFLVLSTGILGGIYLFRQFARSLDNNRHYLGRCSIPYIDPELEFDSGTSDRTQLLTAAMQRQLQARLRQIMADSTKQQQRTTADAKLAHVVSEVEHNPDLADRLTFGEIIRDHLDATKMKEDLRRQMTEGDLPSDSTNESSEESSKTNNNNNGRDVVESDDDDDDDDDDIDTDEMFADDELDRESPMSLFGQAPRPKSTSGTTGESAAAGVESALGRHHRVGHHANTDILNEESLRALQDDMEQVLHDLQRQVLQSFARHSFDEEFDLDLEEEKYEKIEVPKGFSLSRPGRFIHDFQANLTAIVDMAADRCFIMPLNRSRVFPPKSMFTLLQRMKTGEYDVDTEIVREDYRIVTPMLESPEDFLPLGLFIGRECGPRATYRLERVNPEKTIRQRRSTDEGVIFAEFAGAKITEMKIINLK